MTAPALLRTWDDAHVWHPFAPMQAFRDERVPIVVDADGFELIDADGRRYLDGVSSLWCNVHGHRVPEIDAAIRTQLDRVAHSTLLGLANGPSIELAKRLVDVAPEGLTRVFYSDAGATAVEAALKIAVQYHVQKPHPDPPGRRRLFVSLDAAYHGDTFGSVSVGRTEAFHGPFANLLFETLKVPAPVAFRNPAGFAPAEYLAWCGDEMERVVRGRADEVAAFVVEPLVQGAAGILVHPPGYLRRVRDVTAALDIPLIADEVAVGFGKTGTLFACEQEQVRPDLLCLAKGLSGGYLPLAATLATEPIFEAFLGDPSAGRTFFHGHTFTGNPLGCAAGLASLDLIAQNAVLANVRSNEQLVADRLAPLANHPHVGEVRQRGIMTGIELVRERDGNVPFDPALRTGHRVVLEARRRGVVVRPLGDVVVLMPAVAMPAADVARLCDVVLESIDAAMRSVS
jgi:adenosylmethionine---8-amino-7-oxononanoate aminotransferase